MADANLYEADYYRWLLDQADALRARGRGGNRIDFDRLAEEVEDMGQSELHACESYVRHILVHLYKLAAQGRTEPTRGWRSEILAARANVRRKFTPTIRASVEAILEALHAEAAEIAHANMEEYEPAGPSVPASLRWTLPEILGEANDPLA